MTRIVKRLRRKTHTIKVYEDTELTKGFWALVSDNFGRCCYSTNYQHNMTDALELAKERGPGLVEFYNPRVALP